MTDLELFPDRPEGWEGYVAVLFPDNDLNETLRAQQVDAALAMWGKREERREQYMSRWGSDALAWPAQHPTTVIDVLGPSGTVRGAVCIRCGWIEAGSDDGVLHQEAKDHALAHPHDERLERGENPTDPPRKSVRRAQRRVVGRPPDALRRRIVEARQRLLRSDGADE